MSTLNEQLQEIQEKLSQLDNNNRDHLAEISKLTAQETELKNQMALEEAEQQRIQVQEEKVESITLPYDFDEVFADPRANLMITELLKDMRRQDFAEHNAEVQQLVAENKAQVADLNYRVNSMTEVIANGMAENKELTRENGNLRDHIAQVNLERDDAFAKRDAAVAKAEGLETLLAEKQAHIDKLREEIAIGAAAAVNVMHIDPSERLARLVEESKQAKVKSALDIALERSEPFRGKVITDSQAVAELHTPEVTPFQPVNQAGDTSNQLVTGPVDSVPAEDQVSTFRPEEVHSEPVTVATGQPETSTEAITADYLEQRLAWFATEHGLVSKGV